MISADVAGFSMIARRLSSSIEPFLACCVTRGHREASIECIAAIVERQGEEVMKVINRKEGDKGRSTSLNQA